MATKPSIFRNVLLYCMKSRITPNVRSFEKRCGLRAGIVNAWKDGEPVEPEDLQKLIKATGLRETYWIT